MECEKLQQEKTEIQRHYVMVSIVCSTSCTGGWLVAKYGSKKVELANRDRPVGQGGALDTQSLFAFISIRVRSLLDNR